MTQRARLVLSDAEAALAELEECQNIAYADEGLLRRRYVALMALLRAVGNVLNDTDKPSAGAHLRRAIEKKWGELNDAKPPIFQFVTDVRSAVVKRYEMPENEPDIHMTMEYPRLTIAPYGLAKSNGEKFFPGMLVVDVARLAVEFWRDYLNEVDELARSYEE